MPAACCVGFAGEEGVVVRERLGMLDCGWGEVARVGGGEICCGRFYGGGIGVCGRGCG